MLAMIHAPRLDGFRKFEPREKDRALLDRFFLEMLDFETFGLTLFDDGGGDAFADLVVVVSDNMSWVDAEGGGRSTATMAEWETFRRRNPEARLVCLDVQPYGTTQAAERSDILNVGGFSDAVFEVIAAFAKNELTPAHWVGRIEELAL